MELYEREHQLLSEKPIVLNFHLKPDLYILLFNKIIHFK